MRLHLCTVPGQIALDQTRRLVLRNVDGIVFVVDSQRERLDDNIASIRNLEANLLLQGDDPSRMPLVVQYNKRDLPTLAAGSRAPRSARRARGRARSAGQRCQGRGRVRDVQGHRQVAA